MPAPARQGPVPPLVLTPALDDSPEIVQALGDRARALSRFPREEAVLLIAHGPNDSRDNARWRARLRRIARDLKKKNGFFSVEGLTLQEDAPPHVREAATQALRNRAHHWAQKGKRVLAVPVLISEGGIERGVAKRLEGLPVSLGRPLLDHGALSQWLARQVRDAAKAFPKDTP